MRTFRHDIQGHLNILKTYLDEGKTQDAAGYMNRIFSEFTSAKLPYNTGNRMADGILSSRHDAIIENDIAVDITGAFGVLNKFDEFSICTIFQNAVQNAIEACMKIDDENKRRIHIGCTQKDKNIFLTFSNPVKASVKIKDNAIVTTKADYYNHGLGTKQIERAAADLYGRAVFSCKNMIFRVDVMLP